MPWTVERPPKVALNWTESERRRCVAAGNAVLASGGTDEQAIYACIHAAGRSREKGQAGEDSKVAEQKTVPFELTKVDTAGRTFEGYASTFRDPGKDQPDHTGDMIVSGAFKKSLAERGSKVRMLWQHDPSSPIGKFTELREDPKGLYVKGVVSDTRQGRDALALLKDRAIDSMSIGYDAMPGGTDYVKTHDGKSVRLLKEVRLWEVSLVSFPADEAAQVTAVKKEKEVAEPEGQPTETTDLEPAAAAVKAIWEARWEEAKVGQRLNREMRKGLRAIRRMIEDMLDGYEDEEDSQAEPDKEQAARRRKPEDTCEQPKADDPPAERKQEQQAGEDSPPSEPDRLDPPQAERKAGPGTAPPTSTPEADEPRAEGAGPDVTPPTSSDQGATPGNEPAETPQAEDDPDLAAMLREIKALEAIIESG